MKKVQLYILLILAVCLSSSCETQSYDINIRYALKNNSDKVIQLALATFNQTYTIASDELLSVPMGGGPIFIDQAEYQAALENVEEYANPEFLLGATLIIDDKSIVLDQEYSSDVNSPLNIRAYEKKLESENERNHSYLFTFTFTSEVTKELLK